MTVQEFQPLTKHLIALAAAAAFLQGCAAQQTPAAVATRNYDEGISKTCTVSPVEQQGAGPATATITMSNDGWCAVRAMEKDGKPYALALLPDRPEHGVVLLRSLGGQTRAEYTPNSRYVGQDKFVFALRSRTANVPDERVQVAVTVTMGENMAPPPAAAAAERPAARPSTTRRAPPRSGSRPTP